MAAGLVLLMAGFLSSAVAWADGALLLSYQATDPRLSHPSGYAMHRFWATDENHPTESFITSGPYTTALGTTVKPP